ALVFQGGRGGFDDSDHLEAFLAVGQGSTPASDTIQEVLAFDFERFLLLDMGDVAVAVVVRILELGEGIVVRRPLDAGVIDFDFLEGLDVIIDDHALGSDNGHFTDFPRIEPTALDGGKALGAEVYAHGSDIFDASSNVSIARTIYRL